MVFALSGRTPHYGAATPAYEGGRTPVHSSSAWDPTVTNTPAHTLNDDVMQYDEPDSPFNVPSPGTLNPQTPGYNPDTPMGTFFLILCVFLTKNVEWIWI
ncbi:unnamed protein product [Anisakis simplex]|uniref:Uncharacterized protein n=1 Tax=Anisakis simplex TaxID=6269 RepID=A0A3P6PKK6_ANISI|nr:unnamed protein product [Anisakis simplex]